MPTHHSSWVSGFMFLHVGVCLHALWSNIVLSIAVFVLTFSTRCFKHGGQVCSPISRELSVWTQGFHRLLYKPATVGSRSSFP